MHLKHLIILHAILAFASHDAYARDALVSVPVTPVRHEPSHASEMVTQAILGTPVSVHDSEEGSDWVEVTLPDSYVGYINRSALVSLTDDGMERWKQTPRLMIMPMTETRVVADTLLSGARNVITTLTSGAIVEEAADVRDSHSGYCHVVLPDGASGYVPAASTMSLQSFTPGEIDHAALTDSCHALAGTPYLWGGLSTKGMDCSGLVRIAFMTRGLILPRDAADQATTGHPVSDGLRCGDLLFFSPEKNGRITHVGIYDGDGKYIHCSGQVKVSRMAADDPDFSNRTYVGAVRIDGENLQQGTIYITSHPWYF